MGKWKYFSDEEAKGLMPDLLFKLERARELYGSPIIITSGYRDPAHNQAVGGVPESAHTQGKAVDLRCHDPLLQKRLIWALTVAGFRRMGAYDKHVHVDICGENDKKPTPAFWVGESH